MKHDEYTIVYVLLGLCTAPVLDASRNIDWATSAIKTTRLDVIAPDSLKWNAGAVYDVELGWVSVASHNTCFWGHNGRENCEVSKTGPWVAFMGKGPIPQLSAFEENGSRWQYDHPSFAPVLPTDRKAYYILNDARIFSWKRELFVSVAFHAFGSIIRTDLETSYYQAILRLDHDSKSFKFLKIFSERADGAPGPPGMEKNWGFYEHQKKLLAFYSILPCTSIYEVEEGSGSHLEPVVNTCYEDKEELLKTRINFVISRSHNSAHPVTWDNNGDLEILLMVHNRNSYRVGGYNHWLVRMNYKDLTITHLSHGIVFGTTMVHSQGEVQDAIIVGTISITQVSGIDTLHIFGGEGDIHSIYHSVALPSVRWLPIAEVTTSKHVDLRNSST